MKRLIDPACGGRKPKASFIPNGSSAASKPATAGSTDLSRIRLRKHHAFRFGVEVFQHFLDQTRFHLA